MAEVTTIPVPGKLQKTGSEPIKLRRSSTCIIGNRTKDNDVPNYLRASIGSCHDLCKFGGGKHDFNTIERSPMVKGFVAKPPPHKSRELAKDDSVLLQRRSSFSSIPRGPSNCQVKMDEKDINPKPYDGLKQKPLRSKESTMSGTKELRQGNIEISSTLKKTSSINSTTGEKRAMRTTNGTKTSNTNKEPSLGVATSPESRKYNDVRVPKKVSVPEGTKNNRASLAVTGYQTPKADAKIAPKKLRQVKNKNNLNKARIHQSDDHDDVPEKIIHVIEMNTEKSNGPSSELKEKQDSPTSNSLPEVEEAAKFIRPAPQKITDTSDNKKTRKARKDQQSHGSPRKMKFRKGKGIEIEKSNAGSKKLKFKQTKQLNHENQDQNAATKWIKIHPKPDSEGDQSNEMTNEVDEVVLRPQAPIQKENAQSLYNNVIKERAKKLVKTKSKVKALVDAFETIISLQDEKL